MGIPCRHRIRQILETTDVLEIEHFHPQWHLLDSRHLLATRQDGEQNNEDSTMSNLQNNIDSILSNLQGTIAILPPHQQSKMLESLVNLSQTSISIQDPVGVVPRGRPTGSLGSFPSSQSVRRFESSTKRILSAHEHEDIARKRAARICGRCKKPGHNVRRCPERVTFVQ